MHIAAGWHRDAAEPRVLDGAPVAELVRALHAQELLDRGLDGLRMLAQIAHRVGMADEQVDAIADQIGRRLVPGIEQKDAIVQELELAKPLAGARRREKSLASISVERISAGSLCVVAAGRR